MMYYCGPSSIPVCDLVYEKNRDKLNIYINYETLPRKWIFEVGGGEKKVDI